MNRIVKTLISFSLLVCFTIPISAKSDDSNCIVKKSNIFNAKATLVNKETGEISQTKSEIEPIKIQKKTSPLSDEETYEATYEVFANVKNNGEISLLESEDFAKTDAGVKAYATVSYTFKDYGALIKISSISGGWEPTHPMYLVSKRSVKLYQYFTQTGKKLIKSPTSNKFNYVTGWGYGQNVQQPYSATFYTQATLKVSGMSGTEHLLLLQSQFPN